MSLAEALGLSTPTDELAGEELRERLAYLLG